jgi:hypothetical protein
MNPSLKPDESGSATPPPALGERERLVRAEQVKLLYSKAPVVSMATIVNAPLLAFILWGEVWHTALIAWLIAMTMLSMGRLWLALEYRRTPPSLIEDSPWEARYLVGTALAGTGWGAAGFFLFPDASVVHQLFLIFVLGGMTAGAVAAYATTMAGFALFALPALIPLIVRLLIAGGDLNLARAAMVALFAILLMFIARMIHLMILTSLNLRFENRDLVAYLSTTKRQAEKLNDELTFEINERKRAQKDRERLITELQDALANLKVLRGLLPICSHCKKIRDEEGAWQMVETYVREHSNADFSHGICPECLNRLYPELGKNSLPG